MTFSNQNDIVTNLYPWRHKIYKKKRNKVFIINIAANQYHNVDSTLKLIVKFIFYILMIYNFKPITFSNLYFYVKWVK